MSLKRGLPGMTIYKSTEGDSGFVHIDRFPKLKCGLFLETKYKLSFVGNNETVRFIWVSLLSGIP